MSLKFDPKLLMGAFSLTAIVGFVGFDIVQERQQRALIADGHCTKVMEALYSPPPRAHSSCYGDGASRYCSTYYTQADPYMRSLWRCRSPEADARPKEFWRATAEEFAR